MTPDLTYVINTHSGMVTVSGEGEITAEDEMALMFARDFSQMPLPEEGYWPDTNGMLATRIAFRMDGEIIRRPPEDTRPTPPGVVF